MISLRFLTGRIPNFTAAIYKYAALPKEQRTLSLIDQHVRESWLHYNMIVFNAFSTFVIIHDVWTIVSARVWLVKKLQEAISDQLVNLENEGTKLEIAEESIQEDSRQQQSEINALIQKTEQRLALVEQQEKELLELRGKGIAKLLDSIDKLVAQHEALWQSRQQEARNNLAKQLQKHKIGGFGKLTRGCSQIRCC